MCLPLGLRRVGRRREPLCPSPSARTRALQTASPSARKKQKILVNKYNYQSVLRIRDVYPGSQMQGQKIPDPGSGLRIKEFKYF